MRLTSLRESLESESVRRTVLIDAGPGARPVIHRVTKGKTKGGKS